MSASFFNERAIRICTELGLDPDKVRSLAIEAGQIVAEVYGHANPIIFDVRDSPTASGIHR